MPMILEEVATATVDFAPFKTALLATVTPDQILTILASVVGVGIGFVLMWLGVRKLTGAFIAAVSHGKLKI